MGVHDEEFDAQLADSGDDRPGLDDLDDIDPLDTDDDDDLDDLDDDEDDDDYPDDANDEDIDVVAALYFEDGEATAVALDKDLANDLDGLIDALRRMPGDAGALGAVSIDSDFFVLVRVRGKHVQLVLSDVFAAHDWPIARDAADFLGEDIPDDEDDGGPVGDLDMFADAGLPEMEMEALCSDLDSDADELVAVIAKRLGFGAAYDSVAASFDE